jgi:hypothetical protein
MKMKLTLVLALIFTPTLFAITTEEANAYLDKQRHQNDTNQLYLGFPCLQTHVQNKASMEQSVCSIAHYTNIKIHGLKQLRLMR